MSRAMPARVMMPQTKAMLRVPKSACACENRGGQGERGALRNAGGEEQRHGCREREIAYRGNDGLALCGNVFYQQGESNAREEHGWVEHIIESLG